MHKKSFSLSILTLSHKCKWSCAKSDFITDMKHNKRTIDYINQITLGSEFKLQLFTHSYKHQITNTEMNYVQYLAMQKIWYMKDLDL